MSSYWPTPPANPTLMELQLVGAAALGAAGATCVLLTLARRGAAPWLQGKRQKGDCPTNGSLLSGEQSQDSDRCTRRSLAYLPAVNTVMIVSVCQALLGASARSKNKQDWQPLSSARQPLLPLSTVELDMPAPSHKCLGCCNGLTSIKLIDSYHLGFLFCCDCARRHDPYGPYCAGTVRARLGLLFIIMLPSCHRCPHGP